MPTPTTGLFNGWILLLVFGIVFVGVVKSFPPDVVGSLYDESDWTPAQRATTLIGKVVSLALFVVVALTPLDPTTFAFWLGGAIFVSGLIGMVVALTDF